MKRILLLCIWLTSTNLTAQIELPVPRNIELSYSNGVRNKSGIPGNNYWQNHASYDIDISFDPDTRLIDGTVKVLYENNSPDNLDRILFKLYPNVLKKGAMRDEPVGPENINDGVRIEQIKVDNELLELDRVYTDGTNMYVPIENLSPGKTMKFLINYSYILSKDSPEDRTGQVDETSFFVAYFFPRIAVYDDIDGWDRYKYLGIREFYNDFSDFRVAVTVPDQFVVWATGDLKNCQEVLSGEVCTRLSLAEQSEIMITIIDSSDLTGNNVTSNNQYNTFKYEALNVTDFAFATSDHYIWQSTSVEVDDETNRRTRVDAVFNPNHNDFRNVLEIAKNTVHSMSYFLPKWPFPYNHETVFQGLSEMEFPMMVNDHKSPDEAFTAILTIHEIFHTMFPFYMGINETKYAWMDEGWSTMGEWLLYSHIYPGKTDRWGVEEYEQSAGFETDDPIMTLSTHQPKEEYYVNSYFKPALGYLFIRDMLGEELFLKGLHYYIQNWNGKHPIPWDFFNCINTGSGININWFWKAWFFDEGYPDLSIKDVSEKDSKKRITILSKGSKPVPVNLTVTYTDGSDETIHKSIAVWAEGNKETVVVLESKKEIRKLVLDGTHIPDVNKADNIWPL